MEFLKTHSTSVVRTEVRKRGAPCGFFDALNSKSSFSDVRGSGILICHGVHVSDRLDAPHNQRDTN